MTTHIEETVTTIICQHLGVDAARVQPDTKIKDDLGADSLDAIELLMATEEAFDIEITDDEGEKVHTMSDIVALVKTKTNQ